MGHPSVLAYQLDALYSINARLGSLCEKLGSEPCGIDLDQCSVSELLEDALELAEQEFPENGRRTTRPIQQPEPELPEGMN